MISRALGNRKAEAQDLGSLGLTYEALGDLPQACLFYAQRLAIAQQIGDQRGMAIAHWNWGEACIKSGGIEEGLRHLDAAVEIERALNDPVAEQDAAQVAQLRAQ